MNKDEAFKAHKTWTIGNGVIQREGTKICIDITCTNGEKYHLVEVPDKKSKQQKGG